MKEDAQVHWILFLIRANQFFINQRKVTFYTKGDTQTLLITLRPVSLDLPHSSLSHERPGSIRIAS